MKNYVGIIAFILIFFFLKTNIYAIEPYARVWAGVSWFEDSIKDVDVSYNTGIACGSALGCSLFKCVHTEVEVLYLSNDINEIRVDHLKTGLRGNITDFSALANVLLSHPFEMYCLKISPYIGGGAGITYEKTEVHAIGLEKQKDTERRFAYQFFGGLSFPIGQWSFCEVSVDIAGRYLAFDTHVRAVVATGGLSVLF